MLFLGSRSVTRPALTCVCLSLSLSVYSAVLGHGAGAAQSPKASRLVEAILLELCRKHHEGTTIAGVRVNRWGAVMQDYKLIRDNVLNSPVLMASAHIQLFEINQRTLMQW